MRADRAPGRCRAGGGLLSGKDPAGRLVFGVVTSVISGYVACFAESPNERAISSISLLVRFLLGFGIDQLLGFAAKEFKSQQVGWGQVRPFHSRRLLGTRSATQLKGL